MRLYKSSIANTNNRKRYCKAYKEAYKELYMFATFYGWVQQKDNWYASWKKLDNAMSRERLEGNIEKGKLNKLWGDPWGVIDQNNTWPGLVAQLDQAAHSSTSHLPVPGPCPTKAFYLSFKCHNWTTIVREICFEKLVGDERDICVWTETFYKWRRWGGGI